jgi:hypothetical protein
MAVLGRVLVSSAERLDLPDFLSIDSYTQGDFKYLMRSFVGGEKPYVLNGFDVINPSGSVGTQNITIQVADSIVYYPGSEAGPFFHGLEEGNTQAQPLVPELRKNATNYVYLTLTTVEAAKDTRAFWDPDKEAGEGGEFTQDVNTETVLSVDVNVSVSTFPDNTIPIAIVNVGPNFIESIEDARYMMFRLGAGGLNPNPLSTYTFREDPLAQYARKEPNTVTTNALDPNPFKGGDKNIQSLKEWMDVVMTKLKELGGTTYWYEDTSVFNIISVFKDALATSIKSKGYWNSSDISPGVLSWSDDILIQSSADPVDTIIRAGSETLDDNEVLFIERVRNQAINTGSISVEFFNGVDHINGSLGAFENLSKGDWVKKADDPDNYYRRVEEFYAAENKGGGVTAPGSALSVRLSSVYPGISETKQATYSKGVYLSSDLEVDARDADRIQELAGNYYWLAMRSDTILDISNIESTQMTINITQHNGTTALVTSVGHGLQDGQRIYISGSANFDGIYAASVESANEFYINVTGGPFVDETLISAYYATVTTTTKSTDYGLQLESASHGMTRDQRAIISGTSNYNGDYQVYPIDDTNFTIPITAFAADETDGLSTSVNIYVRTDIGPTKLERGENKFIGETESENLMNFIGMDNDAQSYPYYYILPGYNTLDNQENYNADLTDNLTHRVSKLTSMMADKAQDKTINFGFKNCNEVSNVAGAGTLRTVQFSSLTITSPSIEVNIPSSGVAGTVGLSAPINLEENQVAYFQINRNSNFSLGGVTISNFSNLDVDENTFCVAYRGTGNNIYLYDGSEVLQDATIAYKSHKDKQINQNLNADIIAESLWSVSANVGSFDLQLAGEAYVGLQEITKERNTIQPQTISFTAADEVAYVDLNRQDGVADNLTVNVVALENLSNIASPDFLVIARSMPDGVVLFDKTKLKDGESKTLNNHITDQLQAIIDGLVDLVNDNVYDEKISIIAGVAANDNELTGPISAGTTITIPTDGRDGDSVQNYEVGKGVLEVFLNGQYLFNGVDWSELGTLGDASNTFQIDIDLVVDDELTIRIDTFGGYVAGTGGGGENNTASNVGAGAGIFKQKVASDLEFKSIVAGTGVTVVPDADSITINSSATTVSIAVKNTTDTLTLADDFVKCDASGGAFTINLPAAATANGKVYYIKKIDSSLNEVTIDADGLETIDDVSTKILAVQYQSYTIMCDGTQWWIV